MQGQQLLGALVGVACAATATAADHFPSRMQPAGAVVDIAFGPTCRQTGAFARAQTESSHIWSQAGITLRWVAADQLPIGVPGAEWLVVQCAEGAVAASRDAGRIVPIAAIRFIDSRPTNTVTISLDNARTLLARDEAATAGEVPAFAGLRDLRLGRMLGRAIAHEVGHFLSRSGAHTPRGLMRATHSVAALTGASLGPFAVDDEHARGLQARRASPSADDYQF